MVSFSRYLMYSLVLLLVWCCSLPARAQNTAHFTGYLEHQYSLSYTEGQWSQLDYDRARIDLHARAGRNTRISVAPVGQIFRGNTQIRLHEVLPDFLDAGLDSVTIPIENRFYLNHAYLTLRPGNVEVTVGKQYLAWGAALAFNPTELFRPKNVLEPTYEREGVGALSVRIPLGMLSDLMIGFVPEGRVGESGKLVRLRHHIGGYDLSALVAVLHETALPKTFSLLPAETAQRLTLGGDLTGELFGLGAWAEATWSDHAGRQWVEATAGGNYTLAVGTRLMVEAHYNGRGSWDRPYDPALWAGRLTGLLRSMSKVIFYGAASHPVDPLQLWNVGLSAITSAADGSLVLIPSISYSFAQDVDLLFNGLVYMGQDGTEFSGQRYGGFLRVRVYF